MHFNWGQCTSTTGGTGNLTVVDVTGFPGPTDILLTGQHFTYAIFNNANSPPTPLESGIGHLVSSGVISRDYIQCTWNGTTYVQTGATAVNLGSNVIIYMTPLMGSFQPGLPGLCTLGTSLGAFMPEPWQVTTSGTSFAVVADTLYIIPFKGGYTKSVSNAKIRISGSGTGNFLMGIAEVDNTGAPTNVLWQSASTATPASGVVAPLVTWINAAMMGNWYCFLLLFSAGGFNVNSIVSPSNTSAHQPFNLNATAVEAIYAYSAALGSFAIPNPVGMGGLTLTANPSVPAFALF